MSRVLSHIAAKQDPGFHAEGLGQRVDVVEADVALATLHTADIVPVQTGSFGEILLRPASLVPESPDCVPEATAMCGPVEALPGSHAPVMVEDGQGLVYTL